MENIKNLTKIEISNLRNEISEYEISLDFNNNEENILQKYKALDNVMQKIRLLTVLLIKEENYFNVN